MYPKSHCCRTGARNNRDSVRKQGAPPEVLQEPCSTMKAALIVRAFVASATNCHCCACWRSVDRSSNVHRIPSTFCCTHRLKQDEVRFYNSPSAWRINHDSWSFILRLTIGKRTRGEHRTCATPVRHHACIRPFSCPARARPPSSRWDEVVVVPSCKFH